MGKDNEFRSDLIDEPPYVIFLPDKPLDMLLVPQSAGVELDKTVASIIGFRRGEDFSQSIDWKQYESKRVVLSAVEFYRGDNGSPLPYPFLPILFDGGILKSDLKVVYAQDVLDEKLKPFDFPAGEYEYTSTFGDVPQKATIKVDGSTLTVTHSDFGYSEWAEGKTYTLTENLQASTSRRRVYQLTGDAENMFSSTISYFPQDKSFIKSIDGYGVYRLKQ
ncbi:hypothetical protein [Alloscardovia omnicolens]|uniref:hypothetical protein n=1 Tax=Alloscardovia omnicolens TaxID=419015 RepID=UPI000666CF7B|nr:hypothetical protein [Alloscardovia omnicolens]